VAKSNAIDGFDAQAKEVAEHEILERSKRIDSYLVEYTIEYLALLWQIFWRASTLRILKSDFA
jgi:hypothetical protein